MYRTAYQRGMLTVFFSGGANCLEIWDTQTKNGYIKRLLDNEIKTMVMDIRGNNISTTYIICPKGKQVLGIHMPFLVMIVKNLNKYFSFEVTVLDETGTRRRFRVSNFQSTTQILPLCTVMPIGLSQGWNQIQFNLAEFTRRAYKKEFVEVQKVKINANIRLRRIYFTERLMTEDELPPAYKLYFPLQSNVSSVKKAVDEPPPPPPPPAPAPPAPPASDTPVPEVPVKTSSTALASRSVQKVSSVEKATQEAPAEDATAKETTAGETAAAEGTETKAVAAAEGTATGEAGTGEITTGEAATEEAATAEAATEAAVVGETATKEPAPEAAAGDAAAEEAPPGEVVAEVAAVEAAGTDNVPAAEAGALETIPEEPIAVEATPEKAEEEVVA